MVTNPSPSNTGFFVFRISFVRNNILVYEINLASLPFSVGACFQSESSLLGCACLLGMTENVLQYDGVLTYLLTPHHHHHHICTSSHLSFLLIFLPITRKKETKQSSIDCLHHRLVQFNLIIQSIYVCLALPCLADSPHVESFLRAHSKHPKVEPSEHVSKYCKCIIMQAR